MAKSKPPQATSPHPLQRFVWISLPEQLSRRETFLLTLAALLAWGVTGWVLLGQRLPADPNHLPDPYLTGGFFVLFLMALSTVLIRQQLATADPDDESVFRNVRKQVTRVNIFLFASALLVLYLKLSHRDLLNRLLDLEQTFMQSHDGASLIAVTLSIWIPGVFFGRAMYRWARIAHHRRLERLYGEPPRTPRVTMAELIGQDLVTGAMLLAILSFVFRTDVYGALVQWLGPPLQLSQHPPAVTVCTVSWYCPPAGEHGWWVRVMPITITDRLAALFVLLVGCTMVAFAEIAWMLAERMSMGEVVLKLLRGVTVDLVRQVGKLLENLVDLSGHAVWPFLIFFSVLFTSLAAQANMKYLAFLDREHLTGGVGSFFDVRMENLSSLGETLGWLGAAVVLVLLALVFQTYYHNRRQAARQIVLARAKDVPHILLVTLLSTGMIATVLAILDAFLLTVQNTIGGPDLRFHHPFYPMGIIFYLALAEFVWIALAALTSRGQRR